MKRYENTGGWLKQYLSVILIMAMVLTLWPGAVYGTTKDAYGVDAEWYNFRNNPENNSIINVKTPTATERTAMKWAVKYGTGWSASPTPPLILNDKLYIGVNNKVLELDKETGKKLRESDTMIGNVGYAMNPLTYAEGKLFVPVSEGMVQAVDLKTLKCIWHTPKIGGQTLCPISYTEINGKGYIYNGTWNAESKDGSYYCASTDDSNLTEVAGETNGGGKVKALKWRFTPASKITDNNAPSTVQTCDEGLASDEGTKKRGFYWAGAYACRKYIAIGSDDGYGNSKEGNGGVFYTINASTGAVIDKIDGIKGDVRSTTVYNNGYLYFSTEGGILYKVKVNSEGKLSDESHIDIGALTGNESSMSRAAPLVYGNKIYMGMAGPGGRYDADGGHTFQVIDNSGQLTQKSLIYSIPVPGYPQAAALATTAYAGKDYDGDGKGDGRVYIYFAYNAPPGGIYYCYDTPDQKEYRKEQAGEIFVPDKEMQQYCISTICADRDGTLYYKNDSCYLFAVGENPAVLNNVTMTAEKGNEILWNEAFDKTVSDYQLTYSASNKTARLELDFDKDIEVTVDGIKYEGEMTVETPREGKVITLHVTKTAGEKTYEKDYRLSLRAKSDDCNLDSIKVGTANAFNSFVSLTPEFDSNTKVYYADASGSATFWRVWLRKSDPGSTISVTASDNCEKITASEGTSLTEGHDRWNVYKSDNSRNAKIIIKVTAEDGKSVNSYILNLCGEEEKNATQAVVDKINQLPADIQLKDEAAVKAARDAYEMLSDDLKSKVSNYLLLVIAEKDIKNLKLQAEMDKIKAELDRLKTELARKNAVEKTVTGLKVSSKSRKITVSWKATKDITGYQVMYKTKSGKTYKTLTSTESLKAVTGTLKKGTTYNFKARTYTIIEGKKIYGKWSSVKSVKCK